MTEFLGYNPNLLVEAGDLIGFRKDGRPIYNIGGGQTRNVFDDWIPEEDSSEVVQRVRQMSAVEAQGRRVPMNSATLTTPRSAGIGVAVIAKGGTYDEDSSTNDDVILTARKFGRAVRVAEEDIDDSLADIVAAKQRDWATSFAKAFDNGSLAVSAAENGTTVPYTSVYRTVRTTDSGLSYTADDNYVQAASAQPTFDELSDVAGFVEQGDYFDESRLYVIAHPKFKKLIRGVKDTNDMPVFVQGQGGDSGTPDTLFDYPILWSLGARVSATNTDTPDGNALLIVCNADYLIRGTRSGPESVVIDGRSGASALTDETLLKMRARRGFAVGHPKAVGVLEEA